MDPKRKAFCVSCRPKAEDYRAQLYAEHDATEATVKAYLEHCRNCQKANQIQATSSGDSGEVECANNDCERFYKRIEVARDATKVSEKVSRFELDW